MQSPARLTWRGQEIPEEVQWRIALDGQPYTLDEFASWYAEGAAGPWKEAHLATGDLVVEAHEQRRKADAISDSKPVRSDRKPTIVIDTRRGTIEHWPPTPHVGAGDLAIADRAEVDEAPASLPQPQARRPQPQAPAATGAIVDVAEPASEQVTEAPAGDAQAPQRAGSHRRPQPQAPCRPQPQAPQLPASLPQPQPQTRAPTNHGKTSSSSSAGPYQSWPASLPQPQARRPQPQTRAPTNHGKFSWQEREREREGGA